MAPQCSVGPEPDQSAAAAADFELLEAQLAELKALVSTRPAGAEAATTSATTPDDAKAGDGLSLDYLHDLKFGVSLDTYYGFNFNRPIGRVNLLRAYDVTSNNFSLNQASVILESAPDADRTTVRRAHRPAIRPGDRDAAGQPGERATSVGVPQHFQAYGTYVFPVGSGLTVDFGKWASSLGLEGNYTKDQMNYSRSYWFDYLPFYHMGGALNYRFNDAVAVNYWITTARSRPRLQQLQGSVFRPGAQPDEVGDLDHQLLLGTRASATSSRSRRRDHPPCRRSRASRSCRWSRAGRPDCTSSTPMRPGRRRRRRPSRPRRTTW